MGLNLYKANDGDIDFFSRDFFFENPIFFLIMPTGGSREKRVILRSDNKQIFYYTEVRLYALDYKTGLESPLFFFSLDDNGPLSYQNRLEIGDVPLNAELPIWIKFEGNLEVPAEGITNIQVVAAYVEHEV